MNEWNLLAKIILSLALGLTIGIEREVGLKRKQTKSGEVEQGIGGARTFALFSLFGCLASLVVLQDHWTLFYLIFSTFAALIVISYLISFYLFKASGLTTELAALFTFLIGVLIGSEWIPQKITIAIAIVLLLILARKREVKEIVAKFERHEVLAIVGYAIVALVILPFLPNRSYTLLDIPHLREVLQAFGVGTSLLEEIEIVNPFKTWFFVALVSGINFFGYFLSRVIGSSRGLILTSLAGGFLSSTAATQSLAAQSKKVTKKELVYTLAGAALLANASSAIEIVLLVLPINTSFFLKVVPPMLLFCLTAFFIGIFFIKKAKGAKSQEGTEELVTEEPFSLEPALKFAALLIFIKVISKSALVFVGSGVFQATSMIAAIAGEDAVVISLSELTGTSVTVITGLVTLIGVKTINSFSKIVYSFLQGSKKFGQLVALGLIVSLFFSLLGLLVVL